MTSRWRRNLSDATWLFALPLTAAVLPWRWGFALLRWVARRGHGYRAVVDAAWREARAWQPTLDETRFRHDLRLLLLVDRCDSYLTLLHGARWWRRQVDIDGDGLAALHAGLLLNSHWGAGHWIWRLLQAEGIAAHFVVRPAGIHDVGHGYVSRWYLGWRKWALRRVGCAGAIFTGGSRATLEATLARGDSLLGMLDLPAAPSQRQVDVDWLGQRARLPVGLAALAVDAGVAISGICCGLDVASGRRRLVVHAIPPGLPVDAVVRRYAAQVTAQIAVQPALWQLWPQAPLYWATPDGNPAPIG